MIRMRKMFIVAGLVGLMVTMQAGCLAVAAGAGAGAGVMYLRGDLQSTVDAPVERAVAAAEQAVREMNLAMISSESTALDGKVLARTAQDARVTIVVKSESENVSSLSVRVGTFGDQTMSQRILEKIKANL